MLLNSIEDIGLKVVSLAGGVWVLEKTKIMNMIKNSNDNDAVIAAKLSGILSASEYLGNYALSYTIGRATPTLYHTMNEFGYAFLSNAVVLYALDKLKLDSYIVKGGSDESVALQLAVLFVIVQEVSHRVLRMLLR